MKKLLILMSLSMLLFTGCNTFAQEAIEAVYNLNNEALRIKNNTINTANQVKEAINSVNEAVESVNEAVDDIQAIGNSIEDETKIPTETETTSES